MGKYILQKSNARPDGWVLTDTENGLVLTFQEGLFNESQNVVLLNDIANPDALTLARIVREMSEYMLANHKELL